MKNSLLFWDLETIPPQDRKPNPDDVEPPGNYKNPETIKAYQEAKADEVYHKLALNPLEAQVIVISAVYGDGDIHTFKDDNEEHLFKKFDMYLHNLQQNPSSTKDLIKMSPDTWTLVGFNLKEFDIPILFLRAKKYNCSLIQKLLRDLSRYDRRIEDVMIMALPTMKSQYVKMDELCKFFGLEGKGDIDGSMVYNYFKEGKLKEIAEYCAKDVERTRELYKILS